MRKKYRCIKEFDVVRYTDNGIVIPNDRKTVRVGDTYTLDEGAHTIIRTNVHLDGEDGSWIELPEIQLNEFFERMEEQDKGR